MRIPFLAIALVLCLPQVANSKTDGEQEVSRRQISEEAKLFQQYKQSVFTVYSDVGKGSGFLVDNRGLVVTNAHVVGKSDRIRIKLNDSTKVAAIPVVIDEENDIAILRVNSKFTSDLTAPPLPFEAQGDDFAFVGERVLAIGSPLHQETILTTGIISKIEEYAIISDVNINPGNSGGPLFNLDGAIIAINTFRDPSLGGSGVSGSISVKLLEKPLAQAAEKMSYSPDPSDELFPLMPGGQFPLNTLREAALAKKWDEKSYMVSKVQYGTGDFEVQVITPPLLYRLEKAREVKLSERRKKSSASTDEKSNYDPFEDLKSWTQYLGQWAPTVTVYVVPKVGETSGSSLLNIFGAALSGATGTPHYSHHKYEFKADLEDMEVLVDSVAVPEIQRGMTWQPLDFSTGGYGWSASGEDLARAGLAVYEFNLFQPGQNGWPTIEIQLTDQRKPDTEIRFPLPRRTLERIALDFEHYSWVERAREIAIVIDGHGIGGRQ